VSFCFRMCRPCALPPLPLPPVEAHCPAHSYQKWIFFFITQKSCWSEQLNQYVCCCFRLDWLAVGLLLLVSFFFICTFLSVTHKFAYIYWYLVIVLRSVSVIRSLLVQI
jgi:hypothetical protein